ncbi:hypothetical protein [Candidatus Liberibacter brunswickensis]|uniref:hypothetical protein n=1 Tax=Candidatus Liberibacter brunswickensis TaxID=1968796 RepID=UPI002FE2AD63
MKRISTLGLLFVFLGLAINPALARKPNYYKTRSYKSKSIHVKGYCKRNGTCVKDYWRSPPQKY